MLVGRCLGTLAFAPALQVQQDLREQVIAGTAPQTVLVVEHPPTLTLGRRGQRSDILWTDEQLRHLGVAVCETPRGGQTTLHAPGQLVAYPVVHVGMDVRAHVTRLALAGQALLAELGVVGVEFRLDPVGLWVGSAKIGSVGVHVSRGVAIQGISINLQVERRWFGALVSCGMPTVGMTSAAEQGGKALPVAEVARRYAELFAAQVGELLRWDDGSEAQPIVKPDCV